MPKSTSEAESHFNRFKEMMKEILSVPKSELEKREAKYKKQIAAAKRRRQEGTR